jgi:hypothetical protein
MDNLQVIAEFFEGFALEQNKVPDALLPKHRI